MHIVIDARNRRSSTGRYTDRLLEHLQQIDSTNHYTVLLAKGDGWQGSSSNFASLPCPYKQFSLNPFEQIGFAWQLYRLHPDLVHFTMTQQPLLYFGRIVTTTHDLTMLRYTRPGRLPGWLHSLRMVFYRTLFWASHRKSRAIIVPSKFVAKDLASYQPFTKSRTTVTYESSEPPLKTAAEPLAGTKKPFIMHVGSPFPHKNIDRLIEAFTVLKKDFPTLQLVLPGKKEFYFNELLVSIKGSVFEKDIIVPGFVSDGELKWLYQNAEGYVLPSLSEGFGLPGLEAMAHGCPLISSNATCLPEIYGEAAHYFNPEDVDDMTSKISDVLNDNKLKQKLIGAGKEQVKKYSWRQMAEQTLDVYKKILSK